MKSYGGHISPGQGAMLLSAVLSAMLYLQYPEFLVALGGPAAWQVALIMTASALALFLPVAALASRFPGLGLAEISEEVAGPVAGPLLTLAVAAWLLSSAILTARNFTETFIIGMLPETPPSVLAAVALACAMFAAYRGVETITRSTQLFFPLILGGGLLILAFSLPLAQEPLLFPFWGHGLFNTVTGGLQSTGMAAEAIVLLVLGYTFRTGSDLRRSGLIGILTFGGISTLTALVLVMVFGAPDAAQLPFPLFDLSRLIYLGRFFQRTEALMVFLWFFAAAVRLSTLFYAAVVSVSGALRLPYYRPVIFPLAVLLVSLSLLPKDFVTVLRLERDWVRPTGLIVLIVPVLLLVLAAVRKKGGRPHAA